MIPLEVAQLAIAICKEEVEAVIGWTTLDVMDGGSVWGRAFLRTTKAIRSYRCANPPCENRARYSSGMCGVCDITENQGRGELVR